MRGGRGRWRRGGDVPGPSLRPTEACLPCSPCNASSTPISAKLQADVELHARLTSLDEPALETPYFALSWQLTLFAHDVGDLAQIARLFDFFLASHPVMPLYLAAAAVRRQRHAVLAAGDDGAGAYAALKGMRFLTPGGATADELVREAAGLYREVPPSVLASLSSGSRAVAPAAFLQAGVWRVPEEPPPEAPGGAVDMEKQGNLGCGCVRVPGVKTEGRIGIWGMSRDGSEPACPLARPAAVRRGGLALLAQLLGGRRGQKGGPLPSLATTSVRQMCTSPSFAATHANLAGILAARATVRRLHAAMVAGRRAGGSSAGSSRQLQVLAILSSLTGLAVLGGALFMTHSAQTFQT